MMAILETQTNSEEALDPNLVIDSEQGLGVLHSAAFYGKIKPMRALMEKYNADGTMADYRG